MGSVVVVRMISGSGDPSSKVNLYVSVKSVVVGVSKNGVTVFVDAAVPTLYVKGTGAAYSSNFEIFTGSVTSFVNAG